MLKPPIQFTFNCYQVDRYHRELHFTGSPIKVLVSNGSDSPVIPYFVHASAICRFSAWFRANFQEYQRQQQQQEEQAQDTDQVPGSGSGGTWQECTLHIPSCDPEVFEMYLNWQYMERLPIPITMPRDDDYDYEYIYEYEDDSNENNNGADDNNEEKGGDYYEDALLFLTKAYVLGRRVHDQYFQNEIVKIIREIMKKIMNGSVGLERGMDAFERASRIVTEHEG